MDNIIKRDESKLHNVPTKVITTMPIVIFAMLITVIVSIVAFCVHNRVLGCISLAIALTCWAWGKFVDKYYNFQKNYTIDFQNNKVKITYELDNQIYNPKDCTATITIKDITDMKVTSKWIEVYGDITKKQPKQNKKEIKSYRINLQGFENYDSITDRLKEYKV